MDRKEFLTLLDELFELPPGTLKGGESLAELGRWDSTAMLGFMALADEHCGLMLPPRQFASCATVGDLLALLGDRLTG
jgi:acyl carrier protein